MDITETWANMDLSILIVGFDGYKDVWDIDIYLLNKYWSNRPKTYLATSVLKPEYNNVEVIATGDGSEWSKKAYNALKVINTKYVLLLLEDFFISSPVNNTLVLDSLQLIKENKIKFYQVLVQLIKSSWEKGAPFQGNKHIKIIPQDKKYPLNLQAAIWDREFLMETIGEGNYNAWQFEIKQIAISDINVNRIEYLIDDRNILNIEHTIVQSKYLRAPLKRLQIKEPCIDFSSREVLSYKENFKYQLKLLMYSLTPQCLVKPFKRIGKWLSIDFVTDRVAKK
jgi:hypothetical protein